MHHVLSKLCVIVCLFPQLSSPLLSQMDDIHNLAIVLQVVQPFSFDLLMPHHEVILYHVVIVVHQHYQSENKMGRMLVDDLVKAVSIAVVVLDEALLDFV